MASTNICEFCGSTITSNDSKCPNCAAPNPLYVDDTAKIITDPKTIEELQEYCAERGMPLQRMRFFIGVDYKEPKAFGIFKDENGMVTVYKNKADGTRAIRYKGSDEAHGVSELYLKLLEECHNRGIYPDGGSSVVRSGKPEISKEMKRKIEKSLKREAIFKKIGTVLVFAVIALLIIIAVVTSIKHPDGYYGYNDTLYYYKGSTWYYYDNYYDDWYYADGSYTSDIYESARDYYKGDESSWAEDWGAYDFEQSSAYADYVESHSSDSDSSYDSWDSSSTDWGSDW